MLSLQNRRHLSTWLSRLPGLIIVVVMLLGLFLLQAPVETAFAGRLSDVWATADLRAQESGPVTGYRHRNPSGPTRSGGGLHGPAFSGDVPTDFTASDVVSITDPGGVGDVGLPPAAPSGTISGWDVAAIYFDYDGSQDTMYIGIDCQGICGDADGNNLPGGTSTWLFYSGGLDRPNLADTEFAVLLMDTDDDYTPGGPGFEVAVGVDGSSDISSFGSFNFIGDPLNPAFGFGSALPNPTNLYASPHLSTPDLEFSIVDFSTLPDATFIPGQSFTFHIMLGLGSLQDDGIGEDFLPAIGEVMTVTIPAAVHDIDVNKVANPDPVPAGGLLTYTLRYTVTGDEPAPDLTIVDTVPANTTYQTCYGGLSCSESGGTVIWSLGDVTPPVVSSVAMVVQVDISLVSGTLLYNTVLITDSTGLSDTSAITTPVEPPTAVELLYFRADAAGEQTVHLSWATAVEIDNFGFNLYRSSTSNYAQAERIGFVPSLAQGGGATYHYTDTVSSEGYWWYWLADVSTGGGETVHAPAGTMLGGYRLYLPVVIR